MDYGNKLRHMCASVKLTDVDSLYFSCELLQKIKRGVFIRRRAMGCSILGTWH